MDRTRARDVPVIVRTPARAGKRPLWLKCSFLGQSLSTRPFFVRTSFRAKTSTAARPSHFRVDYWILTSCVLATNPILLCEPSQKGISVDAPHRRQAWTTLPSTITRFGPFSVDFTTTSGILTHSPPLPIKGSWPHGSRPQTPPHEPDYSHPADHKHAR